MLKPCADPTRLEAGIDEAGRGCLAGPVVAAAVVWPPDVSGMDTGMLKLVRDSKKLSPAQRERARVFVEEHAVAFAVCFVQPPEIDRINILNATFAAMHGAVDDLGVEVDHLLVDGDRFKIYMSPCTGEFVPHTSVIEGDNTYMSIAAASILAKTHRDRHMREVLHPWHPEYGWDRNKGYGSAEHMSALRTYGPTPEHRTSYAPVRAAMR
jgi:ribonuclease HII